MAEQTANTTAAVNSTVSEQGAVVKTENAASPSPQQPLSPGQAQTPHNQHSPSPPRGGASQVNRTPSPPSRLNTSLRRGQRPFVARAHVEPSDLTLVKRLRDGPGPAAYNPSRGQGRKGVDFGKAKGTRVSGAAFGSSSRFKWASGNRSPGPAAYNIADGRVRRKGGVIGGEARSMDVVATRRTRRFLYNSSSNVSPGVGQYKPEVTEKRHLRLGALPRSPRVTAPSTRSFAPGPGTYNADDSKVRHSSPAAGIAPVTVARKESVLRGAVGTLTMPGRDSPGPVHLPATSLATRVEQRNRITRAHTSFGTVPRLALTPDARDRLKFPGIGDYSLDRDLGKAAPKSHFLTSTRDHPYAGRFGVV